MNPKDLILLEGSAHRIRCPQLVRGLKLTGAISLVVGTVIGTGIFLKTTVMTQQVGSPEIVLLVWVAAGLLSLAGALTYAELGGMLPNTLQTNPLEAAVGLFLIALGLPVYFYFRAKST